MLVKAGAPVDATIAGLLEHMEEGDIIIDGGNEWYENTERRAVQVEAQGILYMGMGVSGGEEGARNGEFLITFAQMAIMITHSYRVAGCEAFFKFEWNVILDSFILCIYFFQNKYKWFSELRDRYFG